MLLVRNSIYASISFLVYAPAVRSSEMAGFIVGCAKLAEMGGPRRGFRGQSRDATHANHRKMLSRRVTAIDI